jgi:F-type H+-transporting ATPase subunit b
MRMKSVRIKSIRMKSICARFALGVSLLLACVSVQAASPANLPPAFAVFFQSPNNSSSQTSQAQQLVKETREAAGEDKTEFTHSGAVGLISRITGLSMEQAYWLCTLLNFSIIAGVIFWLARKNLPTIFRNRTAMIQKAMEEARKASEDANRRLAEIETRLSRLDAEIAQMHSAADKEAAEEEKRIKAAAVEDARRIIESVEQEIATIAKATRRELTAYAANLAVALAKKQIQVDAATDQALVQGFAQQLSSNDERRSKQ